MGLHALLKEAAGRRINLASDRRPSAKGLLPGNGVTRPQIAGIGPWQISDKHNVVFHRVFSLLDWSALISHCAEDTTF